MQCFINLILIVTEPVTYFGTGKNKRQSFHDCTRLLEVPGAGIGRWARNWEKFQYWDCA